MSALTRVRRAVSAKLRDLAVPEVFANATLAAAARETRARGDRAADLRRLEDKVVRLNAKGYLR